MKGAFHWRRGIARLYLSRKEHRRALISVEDCAELVRIDIDSYVDNSEKRF